MAGNGWQPFFTPPTLVLSGTVQLVNNSGSMPITGSATTNTTLKADLSGLSPASAQSGSGKVTYQWYRDGAKITSATRNTYTLTADDKNKVIYCIVTVSYTHLRNVARVSINCISFTASAVGGNCQAARSCKYGVSIAVNAGGNAAGCSADGILDVYKRQDPSLSSR